MDEKNDDAMKKGGRELQWNHRPSFPSSSIVKYAIMPEIYTLEVAVSQGPGMPV